MTAVALDAVRRTFAEEVRAVGHVESAALVDAFARVPRERFLGAGPWQIWIPGAQDPKYRVTPDDDPRHIYHDVVVALDASRELNNGMPSALARWIEAAQIQPGEAVLHVGCGVGYYTAILAELAGPAGRVVGYEIEPPLAARARDHLAPWPQITIEASDGGDPDGTFDAIFVNAGATHVLPGWVAALRPGGRLIVPLTVHPPGRSSPTMGVGGMLRADRRDGRWPVRLISGVEIYDCTSARDPANEALLFAALSAGQGKDIRALVVEPHEPGPDCIAHIPGSCLQR